MSDSPYAHPQPYDSIALERVAIEGRIATAKKIRDIFAESRPKTAARWQATVGTSSWSISRTSTTGRPPPRWTGLSEETPMAEIRDSLLRTLLRELESGRGMALVAAGSPWQCCAGAREKGPVECTCWGPEYDLPQADPDLDTVVGLALGGIEPPLRPLMCGDCAYRPGSPERTGAEGYEGGPAELDQWAREARFWCHDGMRQPIAWRHPAGIRIAAPSCGDYQPKIIEGVPYRANGEPGLLCAGWAARRRALTAALRGGQQ